ncbi:MAG: DNA polymerase II [Bacteroidetes bacterium]|nr:DNA polymerase II [Bacteroidota bacterium]
MVHDIDAPMDVYKGYILTRERVETSGKHYLRYIGISDQGPFEIIITHNRPLFFIYRDTILPKGFFDCERRRVNLVSFDENPVDALYFKTQHVLYKARHYLREKGIKTFEADIFPEERFLMERFIYGSIEFQGPCFSRDGILRFTNPQIRKGNYRPMFSVLSLDIETGQQGELYSVACHFKGRPSPNSHLQHTVDIDIGVVLIMDDKAGKSADSSSIGIQHDTARSENGVVVVLPDYEHETLSQGGILYRIPYEKDLLDAFLHVIKALDPDIIIGWHVLGFDLLFLEEKYKVYGVPFLIGRDNDPPNIREIRKGTFTADICGRIVIDGPPALRAAFYSFDNYRLETVALELLGVGKDINEETDKVAEIERRFQEDKKGLARYNLLDCTLVSDIFKKTGLIDLTFKRSALTGLAMDRVGMSVAAFDYFMLPHIHRKGYVTPNVQDITNMGHAPGGWVFVKEPGFYEHVVVFDFKSLYPSIIRTFKIDPLSLLRADIDTLNTPVGISFSRTEHVLPEYITELMANREQAKQDNDPHLSQAIKILMNSFYGVMGTPGSRFYNNVLPSAITGTGQWILKNTRDYLEQDGYDVLYGDTDSVFVCLKKVELSDCDSAAGKLVLRINDFITQKINQEFGLESHLEIEFERHFSRFFLPAIRGGGGGAKKRYAGMMIKDGKEELIFTGLEFVRSDWTRFAKNFQYDLFQRIFHDIEVGDWLKKIVLDLKNRIYDDDLMYKKRLTKPPQAYIKVVPPHVKAALLLGEKGDDLKEIRYVMTHRGPIPVDLPHSDVDYNHYIEKQLKPIFDSVMMFFDQSYNEIMGGRQLSLF